MPAVCYGPLCVVHIDVAVHQMRKQELCMSVGATCLALSVSWIEELNGLKWIETVSCGTHADANESVGNDANQTSSPPFLSFRIAVQAPADMSRGHTNTPGPPHPAGDPPPPFPTMCGHASPFGW